MEEFEIRKAGRMVSLEGKIPIFELIELLTGLEASGYSSILFDHEARFELIKSPFGVSKKDQEVYFETLYILEQAEKEELSKNLKQVEENFKNYRKAARAFEDEQTVKANVHMLKQYLDGPLIDSAPLSDRFKNAFDKLKPTEPVTDDFTNELTDQLNQKLS